MLNAFVAVNELDAVLYLERSGQKDDESMTIALPPDIESRIQGEALRRGLAAEDYVRKLIVEHLPPAEAKISLADLFAQWKQEDGTDDPAEIARRNREVEEFKEAMNRNRLESEGPGSRKLFP